MSSFKDVLKMALAGKNKQVHRVVAGTKRAKQLMAQTTNQRTIQRESLESTTGRTHSTRDIQQDN